MSLKLSDNSESSQQLLKNFMQDKSSIRVIIIGNDSVANTAATVADGRATASPAGVARKVAWMEDVDMLALLKSLISSDTGGKPDDIDLSKHNGISISKANGLRYLIRADRSSENSIMESAFNKASI